MKTYKILDILNHREKKNLIKLFFAILVTATLEMIAITSVLPFMELLSHEDTIKEHKYIANLWNFFAFESGRTFLITVGAIVIGLITFANLIAIATKYFQYKYSWNIAYRLSTGLLRTYTNKEYKYFLTENTSELRSYVVAEVNMLVDGILVPLLDCVSQSIMAIILIALIIYIDPIVALFMFGFLGGTYYIIFLSKRNLMIRLGKQRIEANANRYQTVDELMTGIKTIKAFSAERYFFNRFSKYAKIFSDIQPQVKMVMAAPPHLLRILAFGGILAITLYLFIGTGNIESLVPRLTLYAVAGYRLLPALLTVFSAIFKIKHNLPTLEKLYQDLVLSKDPIDPIEKSQDHLSLEKEIKLSNLSFRYSADSDEVLSNINLRIPKGSTTAFIGSTGSGKTTLIDLISGLLVPTAGEIYIDDVQMTNQYEMGWRRNIAYLPQDVFMYDDTILANIALGNSPDEIDKDQVRSVAQIAKIDEWIQELPDQYETEIGERGVRISGGQRQRIGLARALYRKPEVLILDEATSALDSVTEKAIIDSLKGIQRHLTMIIVAHRLSTVRHADKIYILKNGKIIDHGGYEELVTGSETFKQMIELS